MALSSNLTIVVGGVSRAYNETGTLPQGKVRTAILTNGQAGMRISHEEKGARDRALVEFTEDTANVTTGAPLKQKFHIVIDQPQQPNLDAAALKAMIMAGCLWLTADSGANLDRILIGEY